MSRGRSRRRLAASWSRPERAGSGSLELARPDERDGKRFAGVEVRDANEDGEADKNEAGIDTCVARERREHDDALARDERDRADQRDDQRYDERLHGHLSRQPRASVVAW